MIHYCLQLWGRVLLQFPLLLILCVVTMNKNTFLVNSASKLQIMKKKDYPSCSFCRTLLFHTADAYAPVNISLNDHRHFPLPPSTTRGGGGEPVTYCLDNTLTAIPSEETCLFVSTLTLPTCALSGQTSWGSRRILIQTSHPRLQHTDQSEVAAGLLASLHGTRATYLRRRRSCRGLRGPARCRGERSYCAFTL